MAAFCASALAIPTINASSEGICATGTTCDLSTLTVGSNANEFLGAQLTCFGANSPTSVTLTWDNGGSNQSMTNVGSTSAAANNYSGWWKRSAATTGNKTLHAAWTGSTDCYLLAVDFFSAADITNYQAASGNAGPSVTITMTGAAGTSLAYAGARDNNNDLGVAAWTSGTFVAENTGGCCFHGWAKGTAAQVFTVTSSGDYLLDGVEITVSGGGGSTSGSKKSNKLRKLGVIP